MGGRVPSRRVPCPLTPSSYLVRDPHPCLPPTHLPRPSGPRATPPRPTPAPTAIRPRARTRLERRARSQSVSLSATCVPVVSQCLRNNILLLFLLA